MTDSSPKWFDDPWIKQHSIVTPQKQHAIGFVTLAWNTTEYLEHALFSTVLGVQEATGRIISHNMGDVTIWEKIIQIAKHKALKADILDALEHARKYYDVCRSNRNTLVHSALIMGQTIDESALKLARIKGPNMRSQDFNDSLDSVRKIGEQIRILNSYLDDLCLCVYYEGNPLPEKSALPEFLWKPHQPKHPKP